MTKCMYIFYFPLPVSRRDFVKPKCIRRVTFNIVRGHWEVSGVKRVDRFVWETLAFTGAFFCKLWRLYTPVVLKLFNTTDYLENFWRVANRVPMTFFLFVFTYYNHYRLCWNTFFFIFSRMRTENLRYTQGMRRDVAIIQRDNNATN